MPFLFALVTAVVVGFLMWRLMVRQPVERSADDQRSRPALAPDDDPEFLRELGERLRREGEDPQSRR